MIPFDTPENIRTFSHVFGGIKKEHWEENNIFEVNWDVFKTLSNRVGTFWTKKTLLELFER